MRVETPWILAHRGANSDAPENTLSAMCCAATRYKASWVECDVQLTQDQQLIIFHDETLERTTNGAGLVCEKNLTAIKRLDAGAWFHPKFTGEKIPTLAELMDIAVKYKLKVNLELKPTHFQRRLFLDKILAVLGAYGNDSQNNILLSSFDFETLHLLEGLKTGYPIGLLVHEWCDDVLVFARQLKSCISVHLNNDIVTPERVEKIKAAGYKVLSYTVNQPKRARELFRWGVAGIFTDRLGAICSSYEQ